MSPSISSTNRDGWHGCPPELTEDEPFLAAVTELHRELFQRHFRQDPAVNPALGIEIRAFRRTGEWRIFLLLTPWMLARILVPDRDPGVAIPPAWQAETRRGMEFQLLGPTVSVNLLGQQQSAHLGHHPQLGHYLLQPLAMNMEQYRSADEVFAAWNEVIRTRDENMAKMQRDCPWQKEVSRREFFRLGRGKQP